MKIKGKIKKFFPNLCVNKSWALSKEVSRLPRFIAEYLILKFTEEETLNFKKLQEWIKKYYPLPEEKNKILYQIKKEGYIWLADEFKVEMRYSGREIIKQVHIPILQIHNAEIKNEIIDNYKDLLRFGSWGLAKLEFNNKVLFNIQVLLSSNFSGEVSENLKNFMMELVKKIEKKIFFWKNEGEIIPELFPEEMNEENDNEALAKRLENDNISLYVKVKIESGEIFDENEEVFLRKEQNNEIIQILPSVSIKTEFFSVEKKHWLRPMQMSIPLYKKQKEKIHEVDAEVNEFFDSVYNGIILQNIGYLKITDFKPFQIYSLAVELFVKNRENFSTKEWKALLINSLGLNPEAYNSKQMLYILSRLIPLCENNVNLLELGPKATGKTYIYRNASLYTRIIAGGKVSPANLFYHGTYKTIGEIGVRDCIIFDELSKMYFPEEVVSKLKDYMVDGFFERLGLKRASSTCSLVFIDNIEIENTEEFEFSLPSILKDTAFMDRIHGFIPGWKIPKILKSEESLSKDWGLTSDYLSEILHWLRDNLNFTEFIENTIKLKGKLTIRDEKGIRKIISGLLKILYPCLNSKNFKISKEELSEVVETAIELRQMVREILHFLEPSEFPKIDIKYELLL